nr:hypothetical protein [uncultured Rhodopila sp.]
MTVAQIDLFGSSPAPSPMAVTSQPAQPPMAQPFPTPPTLPWARRLTAAGTVARDISFLVSWFWTGEIVEALCMGSGFSRRELLAAHPTRFGMLPFIGNPETRVERPADETRHGFSAHAADQNR